MTAVATNPLTSTSSVKPIHFIGIVLGVLMIGAYIFLPFANQPEFGASTINFITEARSNNELGIITNGLILIPVAGIASVLLGVWNILQPQISRTIALLIALAGIICLTYYMVFAQDYLEQEASYINAMGIAFWGILGLGIAMVLQAAIPRQKPPPKYTILKVLGNQEFVIVAGLLALVVFVGISNPRFLAERNISDVLQGNAYIAVAAIGMSMVIITGNIDISVGSLIGALAVVSGNLALDGWPIILAWLAPLVLGGLVGAFIGFLVAYLRIPSIVVTLGMLSIIKGLLIIATNGERVINLPEGYFLAQMRPFGIAMPIYFMVVMTIIASLWLRYSAFGRSLYAIGGNAEAAKLSGISEQRVIFQVFIINGVIAGIASVLYATQLSVIQATPPPALELTIITASVVGGVSILGGTGTVIGSTLAAILLNTIRSAMVFINVSPFWLRAVQGVLILATVLVDLIRRRRQSL